jgi:hypothetical protein
MGKPSSSRLEAHRVMIRARYAAAIAHDLKAFAQHWPSAPDWLKAEVKRMGADVWTNRYGAKPARPKPKVTLLMHRLAQTIAKERALRR